MKQRGNDVNVRIKAFMKKKMDEFPELKQKNGPDLKVVQRGYFLEDIMSLIPRRG